MFIGLNNAITGLTQDQLSKTINSLFSKNEQGVWYDPSDLSTLYQDAAGTTPVTAVEQPVGLIKDKSGRGNHAFQATSASRPVLSARVNLLTTTETLATQTVTTRATTQTLRFEGAGTVTLSGTATGTYSAGSHSVTTTAGNLTLTVSGTVTKADLRATNMGVGLPAYQRVNTSTDYDTAGFPHYLLFDGVDDYLSTGPIDFTGTDKMTVLVGLRKFNPLGKFSHLVRLGTSTQSTNTFYIAAPSGSGQYTFMSAGSVQDFAFSQNNQYSAPNTAIVSAVSDIAAPSILLRINGGKEVLSNNNSHGSGKYSNNPIYIGNAGTNPFNGQLFGLVIRGALSSTGEIQGSESYMNLHTGAY